MNTDSAKFVDDIGNSVWLCSTSSGDVYRSIASSEQIPSVWLKDLWTEAVRVNRETIWEALPDRIGDRVEGSTHPVREADWRFLARMSAGDGPSAIAAFRALGRLAEDDPSLRRPARIAFAGGLTKRNPYVRHAAVEGIWQARVRDAAPELADAVKNEQCEPVLQLMQHVLAIFR
jgi:hypothetical protein